MYLYRFSILAVLAQLVMYKHGFSRDGVGIPLGTTWAISVFKEVAPIKHIVKNP